MQKQIKPLLTELFWLLGSFTLSFIITRIAFQIALGNMGLDIHLHDTYFVLPAWMITIPLFVFITFLTFFIKELRHKFERTFQSMIIIVSGLALIILWTSLSKQLIRFSLQTGGNWTSYPPLSALPQQKLNVVKDADIFFDRLVNSLTVMQLIIMVCLLFVSYFWGARKHNSQPIRP